MKTFTFAAVALAAFVFAAPAAAKELKSASVCGASGCNQLPKEGGLHAYVEGEDAVAAPAASPYYELRATVEGDGETVSWTSYYVAAANVLASPADEDHATSWTRLPDASRAAFAKATVGLVPFPKPRITAAFVDGQEVRGDASTYARLLSLPEKFTPYPSEWDWVAIDLRSTRNTPWTASGRDLVYSPSANLLERGSARVPVPPSLAPDIEAARALGTGSAFPWTSVLVAVAASLVAATLLVLAARRRPVLRSRPVPTG